MRSHRNRMHAQRPRFLGTHATAAATCESGNKARRAVSNIAACARNTMAVHGRRGGGEYKRALAARSSSVELSSPSAAYSTSVAAAAAAAMAPTMPLLVGIASLSLACLVNAVPVSWLSAVCS